jgi:tellurite resistance protein
MKGVIIIGVLLVIFLVRALFEWVSGSGGGGEEYRKLKREVDRGLIVKSKPESITLDSGDAIDVYTVVLSGTVAVPKPESKCELIVTMADITHDMDDNEDWPVVCMIPGLANGEGLFESHEEITIPYEISTIDSVPVLSVPISALLFPKKGPRKVRISVFLTDAQNPNHSFSHGKTVIHHEQNFYGYTEIQKRDLEADKVIVSLAMCLCAADGSVSETETAVIHGYCTDSFMNLEGDEVEKRKESVDRTMGIFLENFKAGGDVSALWEQACGRVMDRHGPDVAQAAYELCLRVAAADGAADDSELALLDKMVQRLEIPEQLDRELRDRYFKLAMFGEQSHDDLLGMPDGLSHDEKVAFLNSEYQKWRRRVTHEDSNVATEAALRIKKIAEARQRLENE